MEFKAASRGVFAKCSRMADMGRHELTDDQWARLAPLMPPRFTGRRGRPFHGHRRIINGMLWITKRGALARLARALWAVANRRHALLSVAAKRAVGAHLGRAAATGRYAWRGQLGAALRR